MDISKLQGAQSFTVQKLNAPPSSKELEALKNNGKVDLVIQDGDQTVIVSGEAIDINEYNQKMGKAIPNFKMGAYYNPDLKPLKMMDENKDGKLTEAETRHGVKAGLSAGWDHAVGGAIVGGATDGATYGAIRGSFTIAGINMSKPGMIAGGFVGGAIGLIKSPFAGAKAIGKTIGEQKSVQTWNFTNHLKAAQ